MTINFIGVLAAAVASWIFGAVYYGLLGRQWMAALGRSEEECAQAGKQAPPVAALIISFVAEIVMAAMLAGLLAHMGGPNVRAGLITGALMWFGFVVTVLGTNYAYEKARPSLMTINSGHWLGVLLVQGLALGLIG